jgi:hypothetical protein
MKIRTIRQIAICTAALLTFLTGPLSVSLGSDEPLAILLADAVEDVEDDDDREVWTFYVAELIVEASHEFSVFRPISIDSAIPIVSGPHNERGPPVA